jgi:hypothetical protein
MKCMCWNNKEETQINKSEFSGTELNVTGTAYGTVADLYTQS